MIPEKMHSINVHHSISPAVYANFSLDQVIEMVTKVSVVYTSLEYVVMKDGTKLCDASKANMRRAQADIQRIRLKLLDSLEEKRAK